jgi:CRP-like cAMP-binding protein
VEEALDAVPLFAAIDRRALGAQGQLVAAAEGEQIVREGEHGDRFYVLLEGELEASSRGRTVQLFQAGDWFGEIALLHTVPRRATVTARTPVRLWALAREAFLAALHEAAALDSTLAVAVDLPVAQAGPAAGLVGLAGAGLLV